MPTRRTITGFYLAAAATGVLCLAGCASTAPPAPGPDEVPTWDYPQVVVDASLEDLMVANEPIVQYATDTLPMRVSVPLRSIAQRSLYLEYRFVFYGPGKERLTRNPVWREVRFPARTRRNIEANAISLRAVDWELEVRRRR